MKGSLFGLLCLLMLTACPGEKKPEAGDFEPLPVFDPAEVAPPPPAPPPAAPTAAAPTAPAVEEVKTCCIFSDGNRMKGLTAQECKESEGTFDPDCNGKIPEPSVPATAVDEEEGPCCTFPNGMMRRGIPQEACATAKGVYGYDCEEGED